MQRKQKGVCLETLLNNFGKIQTKLNHFKGKLCRVRSSNPLPSKIGYPILKFLL